MFPDRTASGSDARKEVASDRQLDGCFAFPIVAVKPMHQPNQNNLQIRLNSPNPQSRYLAMERLARLLRHGWRTDWVRLNLPKNTTVVSEIELDVEALPPNLSCKCL